jgi:N-acetyl-gamma-glutamyl-phosphate reductase
MKTVFIDGSAGTTGLRIHDRLAQRSDLQVITLSEDCRKDPAARAAAINSADVAFLCLPDDAARESAAMVTNPDTVVLDTSTAHRTAPGWTYGFPEVSDKLKNALPDAKRIAVPGCHASGFIALVAPLVEAGLLDENALLTCHSLTGYSGGGKKMIADYQSPERSSLLDAPRQYALTQKHKHLPEMQALTGLKHAPVFCPIVADYYSGMEVVVPLFVKDLKGTPEDVKQLYKNCYHTAMVHYEDAADESGFLSANALSGRDDMQVTVCGNEERILLVARFDNLGKGASGAAIQNMNIMLGLDETTGLNV